MDMLLEKIYNTLYEVIEEDFNNISHGIVTSTIIKDTVCLVGKISLTSISQSPKSCN